MKIFQINGGVFGSTGKIMFGIAETARNMGYEVRCAAPVTTTNRFKEPVDNYIKMGTFYGRCVNVLLARITGFEGCFSVLPTIKLIREIRKFNPDIIHLHNIHNSYVNLLILFKFLQHSNIKVVWTLHDCWAFTGHCPFFDSVGCIKWKTGCKECLKYKEYPKTYLDNSRTMYRLKQRLFLSIKEMTIITPSEWMASVVKESYLACYPIKVVNNGIDLATFRPVESNFRIKYHCENKCILLGVSFVWSELKGLDVFIKLSKRLSDEYQIVLVGTDTFVDSQLPDNIISIHRTQGQQELAEIYSAADLFVNPTREDNFPTVNIEALACGTPVITFETGGSAEMIDEICGEIVKKDDYITLEKVILKKRSWKKDVTKACIKQAEKYNMYSKFKEVVDIYQGR